MLEKIKLFFILDFKVQYYISNDIDFNHRYLARETTHKMSMSKSSKKKQFK